MGSFLTGYQFSCAALSKSPFLTVTTVILVLLVFSGNRLLIERHSSINLMNTTSLTAFSATIGELVKSGKCSGIIGCVGYQDDDEYLNRRHLSFKNSQYYVVSQGFDDRKIGGDYGVLVQHPDARPLSIYTIKDVVNCLDSLFIKRKKRPLHMAFMGDSTVRQHFLNFLQFVPDYDRRYQRNSTVFAQYYFHEDRNATSRVLNNLLVSFRWRNLMRSDLIADFQRWSTHSHDQSQRTTPVPDIIVIGITCHHLRNNEVASRLEDYEYILERILLPLMKQSLKVNPHQQIIWVHQSPTNDYVGPSFTESSLTVAIVNNEKIQHYNQSIRRILRNSGIVMWDSINLVIEDYLRACALNRMLRDDNPQYFNCDDYIHPGYVALSISTQLLINHICSAA